MKHKEVQELKAEAQRFLGQSIQFSFTVNGAVQRVANCEFIEIEVTPIGVFTDDQEYKVDAVMHEEIAGYEHRWPLQKVVKQFLWEEQEARK